MFNVIGAGCVGQTFAYGFAQNGWKLQGVCNQHSSQQAIAWIGSGQAYTLEQMPSAPLWMLGPPDDLLVPVAQALAASGKVRPGDIVVYFSGSLAASVLDCLPGAALSLHPMMTFPKPVRQLAGIPLGCEGNVDALAQLQPTLDSLGLQCMPIPSASKVFYHAMGVFTSNYQYALLKLAVECGRRCDLDEAQVLKLLNPLAKVTLDNAFEQGWQGLTGPIARGDLELVRQQISQLAQENPALAEAYRVLGKTLLDVTPASSDMRCLLEP